MGAGRDGLEEAEGLEGEGWGFGGHCWRRWRAEAGGVVVVVVRTRCCFLELELELGAWSLELQWRLKAGAGLAGEGQVVSGGTCPYSC